MTLLEYVQTLSSDISLTEKIALTKAWKNKNDQPVQQPVIEEEEEKEEEEVKTPPVVKKAKFNNDGSLHVSNTQTKFIGYESNQNNWKLREFRRKIEKDKKYEIIIDDARLIKESELQEKDLMDRILNNVDLGEFSNIIEESNKNYIRETLQYLNMEIKFVDSLESYQEGISTFLETYKIEINNKLDYSVLPKNN